MRTGSTYIPKPNPARDAIVEETKNGTYVSPVPQMAISDAHLVRLSAIEHFEKAMDGFPPGNVDHEAQVMGESVFKAATDLTLNEQARSEYITSIVSSHMLRRIYTETTFPGIIGKIAYGLVWVAAKLLRRRVILHNA